MAIDDMEHYYEASSDAWERFAWLRARPVAGSKVLGSDLLERMRPFVFSRSLSSSDLDRFVEIKNEMSKARRRRGHWNVKLGDGGIRDIEFFVQMLQLVNGGTRPQLRTPGTLQALDGLSGLGLIHADERRELRSSYLFLRRLENRLQMADEGQTHEVPDDPRRRLVLARSLDVAGESDDEVLHRFEAELLVHRSIAQGYFERILPGGRDHEH
jgi:glutamate-ammonia-ligase adenylyltransferase